MLNFFRVQRDIVPKPIQLVACLAWFLVLAVRLGVFFQRFLGHPGLILDLFPFNTPDRLSIMRFPSPQGLDLLWSKLNPKKLQSAFYPVLFSYSPKSLPLHSTKTLTQKILHPAAAASHSTSPYTHRSASLHTRPYPCSRNLYIHFPPYYPVNSLNVGHIGYLFVSHNPGYYIAVNL